MRLRSDSNSTTGKDQFEKGDQFEMLVMRSIKSQGLEKYFKKYDPRFNSTSRIIVVNRTKGSRGEGDLLLIYQHGDTNETGTLIIQAKRNGYIDPNDRKKYLKIIDAINKDPYKKVMMFLAHYTHGKFWKFTPLRSESDLFQRRYR
jgi:hypothetical protein